MARQVKFINLKKAQQQSKAIYASGWHKKQYEQQYEQQYE